MTYGCMHILTASVLLCVEEFFQTADETDAVKPGSVRFVCVDWSGFWLNVLSQDEVLVQPFFQLVRH
jgi:hypothetical protein